VKNGFSQDCISHLRQTHDCHMIRYLLYGTESYRSTVIWSDMFFYVHGSVHRESMSITVQQDETIYSLLYFCKLLFIFRVVTQPIIRSIYNCNYSIWNCRSNGSTITEGSRDGLNSARCCNYSYMCSWLWVELPPETCRAAYRNIINCILSHLVGQLLTSI